eukprot:3764763-Prymnesium_polylepis.1
MLNTAPRCEDDANNEALLYIESRELYGGLLRLDSTATNFFVQVELELRAVLTMEKVLLLREQAVEVAAKTVDQ